jgi:hypothetical protein
MRSSPWNVWAKTLRANKQQVVLFNRARQSRDDALDRVEAGSDPAWQAQAFAAVRKTAEVMQEFISDDVWQTGLAAPREARALGPIFLHAVRSGWIVKTGRVRPSVRSHLSGKPVWRSLIYLGTRANISR